MAYPLHTLFQFGGPLNAAGTADEIWQCNIRGIAPGGGAITDEDTYLSDVAGKLSTWFSGNPAGMSSNSSLGYLKVNAINAAGKYASGTTTHQHLYSPAVAGSFTTSIPAFCSVCFTFRTDIARGPGSHGRIYPPNFSYSAVQGSSVSATSQGNARDAGKALLDIVLNKGGSEELVPCVVSAKSGQAQPITRVGAGNLYDYQSRRKNRGALLYSFVAASTP